MKFKKKFFGFSALVVGLVPLVAVSCNNGSKKKVEMPEEVKTLVNQLQKFNYAGLTESEFKALAFDNLPVKSVEFQEKVMAVIPDETLKTLFNLDTTYTITASKKANEDKITYKYQSGNDVFTSETKYVKMISDTDRAQIDAWKQAVKNIKGTWRPWEDWQNKSYTQQSVKIGDQYKNIDGGIQSIDGRTRGAVGLQADKILEIKAKAKDVTTGKYRNTYILKAKGSATIKYALRIDLENGRRIFADVEVPYTETDCPNAKVLGDVLHKISYVYKTTLKATDFKAKTFDSNVIYDVVIDAKTMDANYGSGGPLKLNVLFHDKSNLPLKDALGGGDKVAMHIKKEAGSTIVQYTLTYNESGSTDTQTATMSLEITQFGQ